LILSTRAEPVDAGAGNSEPLSNLRRAESFGHEHGDVGSPDRTRPPFVDALRIRGGYAFRLKPRSTQAQ